MHTKSLVCIRNTYCIHTRMWPRQTGRKRNHILQCLPRALLPSCCTTYVSHRLHSLIGSAFVHMQQVHCVSLPLKWKKTAVDKEMYKLAYVSSVSYSVTPPPSTRTDLTKSGLVFCTSASALYLLRASFPEMRTHPHLF